MKSHKRPPIWAGALGLVAHPVLILAADAAAPAEEQASGALEQIVVTAQRRAENSQNVPIAIATVSGEQLKSSGITNTLQLPAIDPALQVQYEDGSMQTRIRGVGTTSNGPGVENPIAVYVDGVYYAAQVMAGQSLGAVSQISVLKGPQGTLFGRNATGGVIQISTKDPTRQFHLDLDTDLDNYLTSRSNLYVSNAITENLAANFSASYAYQADGWGDNLVTGQNDVHRVKRDLAFRSKWLYTPNSDTSVRFSFDYDNRADTLGLNIVPFPGTAPYTLVPGYRYSDNPWDADLYENGVLGLNSGGASITLDQNLPFAHLQNIAAYRQFFFNSSFSGTAAPVPGQELNVPQAGRQVTEELQLTSLNDSAVKWAAGVYLFYDEDGTSDKNLNIYLYPPFFGPSLTAIGVNTKLQARSAAGFAQVTAPIPALADTNITLGARETWEQRRFQGTESVDGFTLPLPPVPPETTVNRPTWRVALDHKLQEDLLGYVSYNRGFKSGGYNGYDPTNPPYGPEIVDAYELGLKSEFLNHTIRINAAGFFNKYANIQVSRYTTTAVIYNGARAHTGGLDLDMEARVGPLQLRAAVEGLYGKFTSFPNAACSAPNFPGPGITQFSCDATDNQLPRAPKFSANLIADYVLSVPIGTLDFNGTVYHNGGYFYEPDNRLRQGSYDTLNTSVTWSPPTASYRVKLYGTNLLNKAVPAFGGTNATQYSASYENPPRQYGFNLAYSF